VFQILLCACVPYFKTASPVTAHVLVCTSKSLVIQFMKLVCIQSEVIIKASSGSDHVTSEVRNGQINCLTQITKLRGHRDEAEKGVGVGHLGTEIGGRGLRGRLKYLRR
jgi:hypothetical protein